MQGIGNVIAKPAPDFTLIDHTGDYVNLYDSIKVAPALLAFYPKDFGLVCTKQLCNYRDNINEFVDFGVQIFGISPFGREHHAKFAEKYDFPFLLLSDPDKTIAKAFGCSSLLMLGNVSRAVFIVSTSGIILYRYVEPTIATHRNSNELVSILRDLRSAKLL